MSYADGSVYVGEWKDDEKIGRGTISFANGVKYDGEWKDDERVGRGTMTYSTGMTYIGEWKDNVRDCLLYTSPSPRDRTRSRMPSSA